MDKQQVRNTLNQLVEADHDRRAKQMELDRYTQSHEPPRAPSEFENLDAFVDYQEKRQEYHDRLQSLQTALDGANKAYKEAEDTLGRVLPDNVPLRYDYAGQHPELQGVRFTVTNQHVYRERTLVISRSGEPGSEP
jgi:hypothetical protein